MLPINKYLLSSIHLLKRWRHVLWRLMIPMQAHDDGSAHFLCVIHFTFNRSGLLTVPDCKGAKPHYCGPCVSIINVKLMKKKSFHPSMKLKELTGIYLSKGLFTPKYCSNYMVLFLLLKYANTPYIHKQLSIKTTNFGWTFIIENKCWCQ